MISLTRMDGKDVLVNEDWLMVVEENPDTTLIFSSGLKLIVKEHRLELLAKLKAWRAGPAKTVRRTSHLARK